MRRDVCPACMVHTAPAVVLDAGTSSQFTRLMRCPLCGGTWRFCEWRFLDAGEKAASEERRLAKVHERRKAYAADGREREWHRASRERRRVETNRRNRERWASDPEYRERREKSIKKWQQANKEHFYELNRCWRMANPDKMRLSKKKCQLKKLREEKEKENER